MEFLFYVPFQNVTRLSKFNALVRFIIASDEIVFSGYDRISDDYLVLQFIPSNSAKLSSYEHWSIFIQSHFQKLLADG